jgi:hypothetical protein
MSAMETKSQLLLRMAAWMKEHLHEHAETDELCGECTAWECAARHLRLEAGNMPLRELADKVVTTRTKWLEQHGVPISPEFSEFAEAIGNLVDAAYCGASPDQNIHLTEMTTRAHGAEARLEAAEKELAAAWKDASMELPDEDELVLIAVRCEAEGHDDVTQRWEEVHSGTIYRADTTRQLIAVTEDSVEYSDDEVLGWQPLPPAPSQGKEKA